MKMILTHLPTLCRISLDGCSCWRWDPLQKCIISAMQRKELSLCVLIIATRMTYQWRKFEMLILKKTKATDLYCRDLLDETGTQVVDQMLKMNIRAA